MFTKYEKKVTKITDFFQVHRPINSISDCSDADVGYVTVISKQSFSVVIKSSFSLLIVTLSLNQIMKFDTIAFFHFF